MMDETHIDQQNVSSSNVVCVTISELTVSLLSSPRVSVQICKANLQVKVDNRKRRLWKMLTLKY